MNSSWSDSESCGGDILDSQIMDGKKWRSFCACVVKLKVSRPQGRVAAVSLRLMGFGINIKHIVKVD